MDLSKEDLDTIKQELIGMEPILESYFSGKSENKQYGIETLKTDNAQAVEESAYAVENTFDNKIKNLEAKNMKTWGRVKKIKEPGAGAGVMSIHGVDAATMMKTLMRVGALNIYVMPRVSNRGLRDSGKNEVRLAIRQLVKYDS